MQTEDSSGIRFELRPYTKKELRMLYTNVSRTTFYRWLKQIPETANYRSNLLSVIQVAAILKKHGAPGEREFK